MTTRRNVVADDIYGTFNDRKWELERRLREGTLDPVKVCAGLQAVIENSGWSKFPVWRTITHRGQRNAESYRAGRLSTGYMASDWANSMLDRFVTSSVDEEVDLGCASVADLGFEEATRLDVICDRIVTLGYGLCLPEDGPVLREQYLEQSKDEFVRLAMKAICVSDGSLHIFRVGRVGDILWLYGRYGSSDSLFCPRRHFIFRLCKRPLVA